MLLHIDGEVVEIRPGEFFQSKKEVFSRYLEKLNKPKLKRKLSKKARVKTTPIIFKDEIDGSST